MFDMALYRQRVHPDDCEAAEQAMPSSLQSDAPVSTNSIFPLVPPSGGSLIDRMETRRRNGCLFYLPEMCPLGETAAKKNRSSFA
jgi:hypothetical protein